ncbi:MAG TPA: hypothetical protein VNE82_17415 [Candidatus Binataceae bacterium]|nr:hypothetical protein [Candidatus Binataceae bacterium]
MTFLPSFPISMIAFGALAVLALANWYVSGLSVERAPRQTPGANRVDDFRHADGFKKVA